MTLLGLFIGVLGLAIFGLVTKAARPYQEAGTQQGQMSVARGQIAEMDRQNADLRRRIAYLQTDDGKTAEARKMGFVKPGEIPIVVEGQSPLVPALAPPSAPAPLVPHRDSKVRRFWQRLTGH